MNKRGISDIEIIESMSSGNANLKVGKNYIDIEQ